MAGALLAHTLGSTICYLASDLSNGCRGTGAYRTSWLALLVNFHPFGDHHASRQPSTLEPTVHLSSKSAKLNASRGLILMNPFGMPAQNFSPATRIPTLPSEEEIKQLRASLRKDARLKDIHDVVVIILGTGIRPVEFRDLRWTDFNMAHHFIRIVSGKNRSTRCVPYGPRVARALIRQKYQHRDSEFILGESRNAVLKRAARAVRAHTPATCRTITLYVLRQVFARRWVRDGGDLEGLAYVLGHPLPGKSACAGPSDRSLFEKAAKHVSRLWPSRRPRMESSQGTPPREPRGALADSDLPNDELE
jgi:Phage integrase family